MIQRVQARAKGAPLWVPALILFLWIFGKLKQPLAEEGFAMFSWEALQPREQVVLFLNFLFVIPLAVSVRNSWRIGSGEYWFRTLVFGGYLGTNIAELLWNALNLSTTHLFSSNKKS